MELSIDKAEFAKTSLEQISEALKKGLVQNYKSVEISIENCPDLTKWDCPASGLSGNQKIIDVGGEPYMHDKRFIGAEFDFEEIAKRIGSEKSYALGAGSGAMSCLDGHCGELVINENLINNESRSIIARVSPDKKCIVEKYSARINPIDNKPPLWLFIISSNVLNVATFVDGGKILEIISINVSWKPSIGIYGIKVKKTII